MNRIESAAAGSTLNPLDFITETKPAGCADALNAAAIAAIRAGREGIRQAAVAAYQDGARAIAGHCFDVGRWYVAPAPAGRLTGTAGPAGWSAAELTDLATGGLLA